MTRPIDKAVDSILQRVNQFNKLSTDKVITFRVNDHANIRVYKTDNKDKTISDFLCGEALARFYGEFNFGWGWYNSVTIWDSRELNCMESLRYDSYDQDPAELMELVDKELAKRGHQKERMIRWKTKRDTDFS